MKQRFEQMWLLMAIGFVALLACLSYLTDLVEAQDPVRPATVPAGWKTPVNLSGTGTRNSQYPKIVIDEDNVYVVWAEETAADDADIWLRRSPDGGDTWEITRTITGDNLDSPDIAVDSGHDVHLVYEDEQGSDPDKPNIYYRVSVDQGTSFSSLPTRVYTSTPSTAASENPVIAVANDVSGTLYVAWQESAGGGDYNILFSKKDGSDWQVQDVTPYYAPGTPAFHPSIAVSGNTSRTIHVVWEQGVTSADPEVDRRIHYRHSTDGGGSWDPELGEEPTDISSAISGAGVGCNHPVIDIDSNNHIYVAWGTRDQGTEPYSATVHYNKSTDDGSNWASSTITIATTNQPGPFYPYAAPRMAIGSDDKLYVTWQHGAASSGTGLYDVFLRAASSGGSPWSSSQNISDESGNVIEAADVAVDSSGSVHIVWQRLEGGYWDVWYTRGRRLESVYLPIILKND